jgi:hypothetical protein
MGFQARQVSVRYVFDITAGASDGVHRIVIESAGSVKGSGGSAAIVALALEERVRPHLDFDQRVAGGPPLRPGCPLPRSRSTWPSDVPGGIATSSAEPSGTVRRLVAPFTASRKSIASQPILEGDAIAHNGSYITNNGSCITKIRKA